MNSRVKLQAATSLAIVLLVALFLVGLALTDGEASDPNCTVVLAADTPTKLKRLGEVQTQCQSFLEANQNLFKTAADQQRVCAQTMIEAEVIRPIVNVTPCRSDRDAIAKLAKRLAAEKVPTGPAEPFNCTTIHTSLIEMTMLASAQALKTPDGIDSASTCSAIRSREDQITKNLDALKKTTKKKSGKKEICDPAVDRSNALVGLIDKTLILEPALDPSRLSCDPIPVHLDGALPPICGCFLGANGKEET